MTMEEKGKIIKAARKDREMTQEDLAKRTGYSKKDIAAIEDGELGITISGTIDICQVLGISSSQFMPYN